MIDTLCYVFRITTNNNKIFGFTGLDTPLFIDGLEYEPIGAVEVTATNQVAGLDIDNVRLELLLEDNLKVTPSYVISGALDNAAVEIGLVNFLSLPQQLTGDSVIFSGTVATTELTETNINLEILNTTQQLHKNYDVSINSTCRFDFGDSQCRFNLQANGFTHDVNITAFNKTPTGYNLTLGDTLNFTVEYINGTLLFIEGDNAGMKYVVTDVINSVAHIRGEVPTPIKIGDRVRITAGCTKTEGQCRAYNNYSRFGGGRQGGNHFKTLNSVSGSI